MDKKVNYEYIPIKYIRTENFIGDVYGLKVEDDPSYCLGDGILSKNCDLPDIDSDFSDIDRPKIRKRLEQLYGKYNVASVSTFSVLRGRGAMRDVSRVFDVPLKKVNDVCSVIEKKIGEDEGNDHTIEDALLNFEDGKKFYEEFPEVSDLAIKLEGQYRNRGTHAAALVVAENDLRDGTKCGLVLGKEKELVINWDKNTIEYFGLVKLDVLGLKMLTVLNYCRQLIKENHDVEIDFNAIPLDDRRYYEEFSKGNTTGCFQLGSINMKKFCRQLGVDNFNTLVAATALYRPGPLGSGATETYIKRKNGEEEVPAQHPILDEITKDTFGVIIYQEQLMLIMHKLAGMEWSVVDKVRKLVAKSKGADALKKYEEEFVQGCLKNRTLREERAIELWNDLVSFGAYGFNQCLTGDVLLNRGGAEGSTMEITVEEFYKNWHSKSDVGVKYRGKTGVNLMQLQEDNRIRPGKVKGIYKKGEQKVFLITTDTGRKIKATRNHRFLVCRNEEEIYLKVSDMNNGEQIAVMSDYKKTPHRATGVPKYRGCGSKYKSYDDKPGHREGSANVGYVDGRNIIFEKSKAKIITRCNGFCENCGKKIFEKKVDGSLDKCNHPEFAHIRPREDFSPDLELYNHFDNIKYLCNSCHKKFDYNKGERKKRHAKGRDHHFETIISIEYSGVEETYDIEMWAPNHNFTANGFISHNSHACSYTYITVWDMYFKLYYPVEFMTALLTYGTDNKDDQEEYVIESFRMGLDIRPPKVGISDSKQWKIHEGRLYTPFIEINGVGDKTAAGFEKLGKKKGFIDEKEPVSKRFLNILEKIGAYEDKILTDEEADEVSQYLGISLVKNKLYKYKKLIKLLDKDLGFSKVKDINLHDVDFQDKYYFGIITELNLSVKKGKENKFTSATASFKDDTGSCKIGFAKEFYDAFPSEIEHCEGEIIMLQANTSKRAGSVRVEKAWFQNDLIAAEFGDLNLNLLEPGRFQNYDVENCVSCDLHKDGVIPRFSKSGRYNIMVVGETGIDIGYDFLREIKKHGVKERDLNFTSFIKCPLKSAKDVARKHVETCSEWLEEEIQNIRPCLILGIGNTAVKFFTDEDTGINALNATTVWNEKYGCYVCYCTSPSTLYYGGNNITQFQDGIKNFYEKLKNVGLMPF